jgi:hypothetical protein
MPEENYIPAKVIMAARKPHKCFTCLCDIPKKSMYISYPGKNHAGEFQTTHICMECGYLLAQKTGDHKKVIRAGEFSERMIPNFLKKKRADFRRNPQDVLEKSGLLKMEGEQSK